jgi:uncharacterized protein involved in cysteine biosynthesis
MISSFIFGFTLPLRAAGLIASSPQLVFWSALPVGLTLILETLALWKLGAAAQVAVTGFLASRGLTADGTLAWVAAALATLVLVVAGALVFSATASILAAPFNDFLAEKTEPRATPPLAPVPSQGLGWRARLLMIDVFKSLCGASLSALAILLSWLPLINVLSFAVAFAVVCFQFISFPQTRRGEGVGDGIRFILRHPASCLGFGAACSILFAIPFASCFFVPWAVVGGTLLYAKARAADLR